MSRSQVAVLSSTPETVREDLRRLLRLVGAERALSRAQSIKILPDLCRNQYHPATGTTPWQLDGVLQALGESHLKADSMRVVARDRAGLVATRAFDEHGLGSVLRHHGLEVDYIRRDADLISPAALGDDALAPELLRGLSVPAVLEGSALVLLPSLRVRPGPWLSGAIASWVDWSWPRPGAIPLSRWNHCVAQLTRMLKHVSPRTLTVMDATLSGDGSGPRHCDPTVQNVLLASFDPVALDAVAAKLLGWRPEALPVLNLCQRLEAGQADLAQIDILGEDVDAIDFGFRPERGLANCQEAPMSASWAGRLLAGPVGTALSSFYEFCVWRPWIARRQRKLFQRTPWGRLFEAYRRGELPA
jgi:uncharacterized protein (DUF362 family)